MYMHKNDALKAIQQNNPVHHRIFDPYSTNIHDIQDQTVATSYREERNQRFV